MLPIWAERLVYGFVRRAMIGDVSRWGPPGPDHRLFTASDSKAALHADGC